MIRASKQILIVFAVLLFYACGKEEMLYTSGSEETPISFTASESTTRVSQIATTACINSMSVFAYQTTNNFNVTTATPNYMYNQSVSKVKGDWTYTPARFWPTAANEKVSFFAISPAPTVTNGISVVTDESSVGYPSFTVTPPASASQQADLCVATPVLNATYEDPNGDGVDDGSRTVSFAFDHTMAKINFSARYTSSLPGQVNAWVEKIEVTGVTGNGNLQFDENGACIWTTDGTNAGNYTLSFENDELSYAPILRVGADGDDKVSTEAGTLCLVPQTIPAGATLKVTIRTGGLSDEIQTYTSASIPLSGTWEAGKQYTYTFTINDMDIKLNYPDYTNRIWEIAYVSDAAQTFIVPVTGKYKMEIWGNWGGKSGDRFSGGKGGYTAGTIALTAGDICKLYVGPGTYSNAHVEGWNGGGRGGAGNSTPGGSSIDVRFQHIEGNYTFKVLDTATDSNPFLGLTGNESTDPRIIVGGGGGGQGNKNGTRGDNGGAAGGLNGTKTNYTGGGTQTQGGSKHSISNIEYTEGLTGGSVGRGGNAGSNSGAGGGGGGWFGGGGAAYNYKSFACAGGGGSSHVHSQLFTNIVYKSGKDNFLSPDGANETGHAGPGLIRINLLEIK